MPAPFRSSTTEPKDAAASPRRVQRIGCVGYLNSKPLIEGLEGLDDPAVRLDVPSALLADLESGQVDIALCPVIDYYRCRESLVIVPVGCIASDGPTQTVRLFSRVPIDSITRIHADVDSHTSATLIRVLLDAFHGLRPELVPFDALGDAAQGERSADHEAMLLIGDKVVTNAPSEAVYRHQMDLGEAWKKLTGLPFVFAVWMAKADRDLGELPMWLDRQRQINEALTDAIADRHAERHGWEVTHARRYLGRVLNYKVTPEHVTAIEQFAERSAVLGLIDHVRPLRVYGRDR